MTPVAAPWVRTRLRAFPGAPCALALLVALTACLAAVFPRAADRYEDAGLRTAVDRANPGRTSLQLYAPQPDLGLPQPGREDAVRPETLGRQYAKVLAAVPGPLVVDRAQSTYGVRTVDDPEVPDPWLPRPSGLPARVSLVAQQGLAGHARTREGRLPRATGPVTAATARIEAAVTAETAEHLRIKVGSVIHVPGVSRDPLAVRVTGIVTPRDPSGAYWSTRSLLRTPALVRLPKTDTLTYWLGALLLAPEAAPALLGTAGQPERYWQLAPAPEALHAHRTARLKVAVASVESGPGLRRIRTTADGLIQASSELDDVLTSYDRLRAGVQPLVAVAATGAGTVAAVVLLMAGGLAADRRRTELALLRARGASLRAVAGRLCAETAVVALPAGALGLLTALLAAPTDRAGYAIAAAATVTAVGCVALPLRAAAAHRVGTRPRPPRGRGVRTPLPTPYGRRTHPAGAGGRRGRDTAPTRHLGFRRGPTDSSGAGVGRSDRRPHPGPAAPAAVAGAGPPGRTAAGRGGAPLARPGGPYVRLRRTAPAGAADRPDHRCLRRFRPRRRG
ncbi:hypothetical protein SALBM311S_05992 [Streptomyces alboniger]